MFPLQEKSEHILYAFEYHVTTLRGKQKYQVTNVGVKKVNLSRLLVQRINEFKMNEIQRETPQ